MRRLLIIVVIVVLIGGGLVLARQSARNATTETQAASVLDQTTAERGNLLLTVSATGNFDATAGRITALTWKQKDDREQGAVNPASQVEVTVTLKREALAELPKELSDEALAKLSDGEVPAKLTEVRHSDSKGRYQIAHARDSRTAATRRIGASYRPPCSADHARARFRSMRAMTSTQPDAPFLSALSP